MKEVENGPTEEAGYKVEDGGRGEDETEAEETGCICLD